MTDIGSFQFIIEDSWGKGVEISRTLEELILNSNVVDYIMKMIEEILGGAIG